MVEQSKGGQDRVTLFGEYPALVSNNSCMG